MSAKHWSVARLAEELDVSKETVREHCRGDNPAWPHERIGTRPVYRFAPEHVEAIKRLIFVPNARKPVQPAGMSRRSYGRLVGKSRRSA